MKKTSNAQRRTPNVELRGDFVITSGGDAGRLASEVAEIVFNPEVSDYEYFLSRKRYFERKEREAQQP